MCIFLIPFTPIHRWTPDPFPSNKSSCEVNASLLDMPPYILRCLLQLATYIEDEFERHDRKGSFKKRARIENRKVADIRKAWTRRTGIAKQIAEALNDRGSFTQVVVTPDAFFNCFPSPKTASAALPRMRKALELRLVGDASRADQRDCGGGCSFKLRSGVLPD